MKKVSFKSPQEFHTKTGMVFNAVIALPLLPFVWLFLEIQENQYQPLLAESLISRIISFGLTLLAGLIVLRGMRKFKNNFLSKDSNSPLRVRLSVYYQGLSLFYFHVGIASVLLALGLFFTAQWILIIAYMVLLFFMSFRLPTPKRYVKDLHLEGEEKDIILNKKDFEFHQ